METKETTIEELNDFWNQQFEQTQTYETFLAHLRNSQMAEVEENSVNSNGDKWLKIIKGLFLYLPGTWLLFMSANLMFEAYFSMYWDFVQILSGVPCLLLYGFMMILGIGDVKNPKSLSIPLSVVAASFLTFLLSQLFDDQSKWFLFYYSMYLFPIVLMIPIFVKNLLKEEVITDQI